MSQSKIDALKSQINAKEQELKDLQNQLEVEKTNQPPKYIVGDWVFIDYNGDEQIGLINEITTFVSKLNYHIINVISEDMHSNEISIEEQYIRHKIETPNVTNIGNITQKIQHWKDAITKHENGIKSCEDRWHKDWYRWITETPKRMDN